MGMKVQATIQKWGNSLALRLTGPLKTMPGFRENMLVEVDINKNGLKVQPVKRHKKKLPFSEKNLLRGLSAKKAHADEVALINDMEIGE